MGGHLTLAPCMHSWLSRDAMRVTLGTSVNYEALLLVFAEQVMKGDRVAVKSLEPHPSRAVLASRYHPHVDTLIDFNF